MENQNQNQKSILLGMIEENKDLRKENNKLRDENKDFKITIDEITSDNERMEKSIPYLRGLVLGEKHLKETIYKIFIDIMRERKLFHNEVKDFITFTNYLMIVISTLWFIAYAIYFFTKANFFSAYLFIASVGCLLYFLASPKLTVDATANKLLGNRIKDMIKEYNKHQKNNDYLDELVEKC